MKTVLLIDDCLDMLDLNRMLLELNGYKVITAHSGAEALRAVVQHGLPSLILVDYTMPGMDGSEFLERLTEICPNWSEQIPLAMMTALEALPAKVRSKYPAHFISKSVDADNFLARVRRLTNVGENRGQHSVPADRIFFT